MDIERTLEHLEENVYKELDKIAAKGDMSAMELKNALDAACLLEKIGRIRYMDEYEEDEGNSGTYMPNHTYRDGRSYGRSYGNRMATRYDDYDMRRSGHSVEDRIVDKLERMMDEEDSEYGRKVIMEYINEIRKGR